MCHTHGRDPVPQQGIDPRTSRFKVQRSSKGHLELMCHTHGHDRSRGSTLGPLDSKSNAPPLGSKQTICIGENKAQTSFAVNAKLVCAFVFATQIVEVPLFVTYQFHRLMPHLPQSHTGHTPPPLPYAGVASHGSSSWNKSCVNV